MKLTDKTIKQIIQEVIEEKKRRWHKFKPKFREIKQIVRKDFSNALRYNEDTGQIEFSKDGEMHSTKPIDKGDPQDIATDIRAILQGKVSSGDLQEGYMDYIRAEEKALNKFKNVRSLRNQGKATMDDVQAAYREYKAIKDNPEKFLSPQEIARDIADNERRNRESDAKAIARAEEEEAAEKRRREAEVATMMSTRRGYKDRGIDMGPDDPGDIDDLYPQLKEGFLYEGDNSILNLFEDATLEEGNLACGACLFEVLQEASCGCPDLQQEAEYRGRKVKLNKPMRGDVKKFKVYVKDPKTGNIKKVNFGDPNMRIKKSNPKRRKSFRARHNCKNPGPKTKARYWSCRKW